MDEGFHERCVSECAGVTCCAACREGSLVLIAAALAADAAREDDAA